MSAAEGTRAPRSGASVGAFRPGSYDRSAALQAGERQALAAVAGRQPPWPKNARAALSRLLEPIDDALSFCTDQNWGRAPVRGGLIGAMERQGEAFWGFDRERWLVALREFDPNVRGLAIALAYLLTDQRDLHREFPGTKRGLLCRRVFGRAAVDRSVGEIAAHLDGLGYAALLGRPGLKAAVYELMLAAASPELTDIAGRPETFRELRARARPAIGHGVGQLAATLGAMGILASSPFDPARAEQEWLQRSEATNGIPSAWTEFARRWFLTSTLTRRTRKSHYYALAKAGRWVAERDRSFANPGAWTRRHAAEWVAAVDRMAVGEFSNAPNTGYLRQRYGGPLSARSKAHALNVLRRFFTDLQDWEWIDRRFEPRQVFRVPRSISGLIGPEPRVIEADVWAKLLAAGLSLSEADLPRHNIGVPFYPLELVRALALLWLFGGLRKDEIMRLRLGAVRWQTEPDATEAAGVCLLSVPTSKTATAFTKPVDRTVGEAICAWEAARPTQPDFVDPKTSETVAMLFAYRGARVGHSYLNRVLIPLLCRKAGVPRQDVRGPITSHRARATIASQLYNAKDPMSLTELQAWLGHRSPHSTQHYAKLTPTTLARAYSDAGYFARNLRTIEVLVDREAARSGAVAAGEPLEYFDLGHGYCTYSFFEQCPHRMACARCDFYLPKESERAQLLEAKQNLARMALEIPLTDEERAAVEDGEQAVERLLTRLADVATPAGPTPRALGEPISGTELPMLDDADAAKSQNAERDASG